MLIFDCLFLTDENFFPERSIHEIRTEVARQVVTFLRENLPENHKTKFSLHHVFKYVWIQTKILAKKIKFGLKNFFYSHAVGISDFWYSGLKFYFRLIINISHLY